MSKKIRDISQQTENAILRKSAYSLPDRPSASGMKTEDVKKAFYKAVIDEEDSVMSELKRVIKETNEAIDFITGINFESSIEQLPKGSDPSLKVKYDQDSNKYNMDLKVPDGGTDITINGKIQDSWSADFAESERQKSKNLLQLREGLNETVNGITATINDGVITITGTSTKTTANALKQNDIILRAGVPYTLSLHNIVGDMNISIACSVINLRTDEIVYNFMGVHAEGKTFTATPTEDCRIRAIDTYIHNVKTVNTSFNLQLEEGPIATDYHSFGGKIMHAGDLPIMLSEQEVLKSKNLTEFFPFEANLRNTDDYYSVGNNIQFKQVYSIAKNLLYSYNANNTHLTLSRQLYDNYTLIKFTNLKPNTIYTLSFELVSKPTAGQTYIFGVYLDTNSAEGIRYSRQIATNSNGEYESGGAENSIWFTEASSITISKFQLEEGNVATDYQSYNGPIVHEKDLEIKENLYDAGNVININDSTLTTLIEYFDLFNLSPYSIYVADVGASAEFVNNFKNLVGAPLSNANYVKCFIKLAGLGDGNDRLGFRTYELRAINRYGQTWEGTGKDMAIGYIFQNSYGHNADSIRFTGWTVIGG